MKIKQLSLSLALLPFICSGQQIHDDLEVRQLTNHIYQHISCEEVGQWGKVSSNGLIVVSNGKALLIDTPMDSIHTRQLYLYIRDELDADMVAFIPGHWHDDCVGGMPYLKSQGVETYANHQTNELLRANGMETAGHSFTDSLSLTIGEMEIKAYFLGGGHATGNIVVWIPEDQVLFGGCMVKDCTATNIGNLSDASPFPEWLATIRAIERKFPQARFIVPGHGDTGGKELLEHTSRMLQGLMEK
ncbi:MAG: subclass B1 metallo-beta-lactamase [Tannerellaceae bacterium]|nr:subclass B1 metallo-beta-lactamase [Tannerellaceae bacterium]